MLKSREVAEFEMELEMSREKLIGAVRNSPDLVFIRAYGNLGDELIYAGTRRLLAEIPYREVSILNLEKVYGHTGIIAGSGGWCAPYGDMPRFLAAIEERFDRVVVFPSSFDVSVRHVREALAKTRAKVFAREEHSFRQIAELCDADIAYDCAFFFDYSPYRRLEGEGILNAFRTDAEAVDRLLPSDNVDISVVCSSLDEWLWTIARHKVVRTDRAHVMIAAAMLGKRVEYRPSSYHKVPAIAAYSLRWFPVARIPLSDGEGGTAGRGDDLKCFSCSAREEDEDRGPVDELRRSLTAYAEERLGNLLRRKVDRSAEPDVTIVMLSHERLDLTLRALDAIKRNVRVPYRLVVVDNGSAGEVQRALAQAVASDERIKLLLLSENLGCAGGRAYALSHVATEYVMFIDNDIELLPGYVEHLLWVLENHPNVWAATGKVILPDGRVHLCGGQFKVENGVLYFTLLGWGRVWNDPSIGESGECGWVNGGSTLFRRCVFEKYPLDTRLHYYEDLEWCYRVQREVGVGLFYRNTEAIALHHHHSKVSLDFEHRTRLGRGTIEVLEAAAYFYQKHGIVLQSVFDFVPELGGPDDFGIASAQLLLDLVNARGGGWVLRNWNNRVLIPLVRRRDVVAGSALRGSATRAVMSAVDEVKGTLERVLEVVENRMVERNKVVETLQSELNRHVELLQQLKEERAEQDRVIRDLEARFSWKRYRWADSIARFYWYLKQPGLCARRVVWWIREFCRESTPVRLGWRVGRGISRVTMAGASWFAWWLVGETRERAYDRERAGLRQIRQRVGRVLWRLGKRWLPPRVKRWVKRALLQRWKTASNPSVSSDDKKLRTLRDGVEPTDANSGVRNFVKKYPRYDVVILPIIEWNFRFQRPQQLARQFAKNGHRVFYIALKEPTADDRGVVTTRSLESGIMEVLLPGGCGLNIYRQVPTESDITRWMEALTQIAGQFSIEMAVCIVELPFWRPFAVRIRREFGWIIVYDCMDKHSGFSTNDVPMLFQEDLLTQESDLVLASSEQLVVERQSVGGRVVHIPNACEYGHFSVAVGAEPPALACVAGPIIGYFGAISEWFDTRLIREIALANKAWSFVLIGNTFGAELSYLAGLPNVHLLGEEPYEELPRYLHRFDVCIIPFRLTPLTEATDPVKFYEYLAGGKPVVSTPLPALAKPASIGLVYLAQTSSEFAEAIRKALVEDSPEKQAERRQFAQRNTWEVRYNSVDRAIRALYKKATIIVLTYNNLHLTTQCLESVWRATDWPNYDVVIVDNASTDGTREYLAQLVGKRPGWRLLLNEGNEGFAKAINRAMLVATGDYIVILNNDVIVTCGWLSRLLRYLEQDPRIGMIGPVTNSAGNEAKLEISYRNIEEMEEFAAKRSRQYEGRVFDISMLGMFCTVIRREVIDTVGLLDERFEIGMFEDDDYALRVHEAGFRVVCAEDVFVHHFGGATFRQLKTDNYLSLFKKNRRKYEQKWRKRWHPPLTRAVASPDIRTWALRRELEWVLEQHPDRLGVVVYPPTIDWGEALFQRPQQIAKVLSKMGFVFFYCVVNPQVDGVVDFKMIDTNLYLCHVPLEVFDVVDRPIVWVSRADHRGGLRHFRAPIVIYDYIDELEVFHTYGPDLVRDHNALITSADVCLVTARVLYDRVRERRPDAIYCPNGADYEHFARAKHWSQGSLPMDMREIMESGKPVIGYYGALAYWFDYDLIRFVGAVHPDWNIVLIGVDYDGSMRKANVALKNVYWLGSKRYADLPDYLMCFDVATIPFKINKVTLSTSPIKLFEYMAGGKPIVTTDLPECRRYNGVLVARTPEEFIEKIELGLELGKDQEYVELLDRQARENTWEKRVALVLDVLRARGLLTQYQKEGG